MQRYAHVIYEYRIFCNHIFCLDM